MGFEPMIRVLQTLALPLGHVAIRFQIVDCGLRIDNLQTSICNPQSLERAMGFEPTTFSLARRRSTAELRPHSRECREPESDWRHRDFQSRALPTELSRPERGKFYHTWRECQASFYGGEISSADRPVVNCTRDHSPGSCPSEHRFHQVLG